MELMATSRELAGSLILWSFWGFAGVKARWLLRRWAGARACRRPAKIENKL
uniref:Uncharacterized protein n=1 Tax=Solanum tuberosum TaxID=4113 RepID=M1CUI1_SOLTU